jgi:hypothetical protein
MSLIRTKLYLRTRLGATRTSTERQTKPSLHSHTPSGAWPTPTVTHTRPPCVGGRKNPLAISEANGAD